ncbi:MAG: threonyl-tRNA synthetase [Maribacter sp.]|jgi:threonyl-tRNA synthetase
MLINLYPLNIKITKTALYKIVDLKSTHYLCAPYIYDTMIEITLPDGSTKEFEKGATPMDVANSISQGLARNVISAKFEDTIVETTTPLTENGALVLFTWNDQEGKTAFWHSTSHIIAQALEELYPGVKLTIGPAIENGFYYDVDLPEGSISDKDFQKIEQKAIEIARGKHDYKMRSVSKSDALKFYKDQGNEYKVELIENLDDGTITFCDHDSFTDLCRGGHIPNTGIVKAIKILNVAGAYWRGNEKNPQLTRIYGISFPKQKELTAYLELLEEAKKRDHRKLGKELELFTFSQKVGQGLPLWLPKGAALRERLEQFLKKAQKKAGYEMVITPHIGQKELYVTSGHYAKYGEDSFQPIKTPKEDEEFLLKPMNCPHHCEIYNAKPFSYKDLPKRYAEFGTVYRYEQSGELHGLTRVRGFTQDDAHIFCMPEQLDQEFKDVIDLSLYVLESLGFENYTAQVSVRDLDDPDKYIGSVENWEKAEQAIINAAEEKGLNYVIEKGEAAFYGPKLDFMVKDALGRKWQLGTIQVDYNLPERFDLTYKGSDNELHRPVMIHRAPFGSMERFIALLLEHTGGNFPLWLTPEQAIILPVSEKHEKYAEKVLKSLENNEIRALLDSRSETIGKKIREAEMSKVPFMLIVGDTDEKENTISVRKHGGEDLGAITITAFTALVNTEINSTLKSF